MLTMFLSVSPFRPLSLWFIHESASSLQSFLSRNRRNPLSHSSHHLRSSDERASETAHVRTHTHTHTHTRLTCPDDDRKTSAVRKEAVSRLLSLSPVVRMADLAVTVNNTGMWPEAKDCAKIGIVGDMGVGKTCLLRRFQEKSFPTESQVTLGTKQYFVKVPVKCKQKNTTGTVTLQLCDTAST